MAIIFSGDDGTTESSAKGAKGEEYKTQQTKTSLSFLK